MSAASTSEGRVTWSSRMGFLLATVGSAVGLGSIWKFPYMVGENGGGAFVIVYLAALALIILPVLLAEFLIGRLGGGSAVGSLRKVAQDHGSSTAWGLLGVWSVLGGFLILSFYSVIGGWTIAYIPEAFGGAFTGQAESAIAAQFTTMLGDPGRLALWHGVFMAATAGIVALGVISGVERAVTILMPLLFVIIIGLCVYSASIGDFGRTVEFFFTPDFSKITADVVLNAIGLGFFSISVGMGVMITYAAYTDRSINLTSNAVTTIVADTVVSFMAGFAIFPIVFAYALDPAQGPGLMFLTLPIAFAQMPGGAIVGGAFFVLLFVSALASAISLLELIVSWAVEKGIPRVVAALGGGLICWVIGLATVYSFNDWSNYFPLASVPGFEKKTVFDVIDYATSNVMLPVGGILISLFAGWVIARRTAFAELRFTGAFFGRLWWFLVAVVCPIAIAGVLIFQIFFQGSGGGG